MSTEISYKPPIDLDYVKVAYGLARLLGHQGYVAKHVGGNDRFCTVQDSSDERSKIGTAFGIWVAEIRGDQMAYQIVLHRVPEGVVVSSSSLD